MLLAPKPAKEDKIDNIEQKLLHISGVPRLLAHPVLKYISEDITGLIGTAIY